MKRLLIIIFALNSFVFAQVKFGKISEEEIAATQSTLEKDASAEITSKSAYYNIFYDAQNKKFKIEKEVEVRIKIFDKNQAPNRLLNIEIPSRYSEKHTKENISGIKASTYNLADGEIEETKVKSADIFTEKKHDYLEVEKFAFPNVKDGSVLEYKYRIVSNRYYDTDTWFFQSEIPVRFNRFYIEYPEFFIFQKDMRGEINNHVKSNVKNTNFNFKNNVEFSEIKNIPSLRDEPFVQNTDNLRSSIRYELVEFSYPGYIYEKYSASWEQIVKDLYNNSSYGGELKGNNFLNDEAKKFTDSNQIQNMVNIFDYVKSNYHWNGYTGLYPQNGSKKTYNEKSGNGTDLNIILISLLQKAGIQAYPVVLSTVENGMLNYFPSIYKLNHTLTAAIIDNNLFLMDPIQKFSKVNMLPPQDLNFTGYMMKENGKYQQINLMNFVQSEIKNSLNYQIKDEMLVGTLSQTKNNYYAMHDLQKKTKDNSNFEQYVLSDYDCDVSDFTMQENSAGDAVRYTVAFEDSKNLEFIGNKMFINPLLFLSKETNEFNFRNDERKYPLEFGTPFTHITVAQFTIPDGYTTEFVPENLSLILDNQNGGYDLRFEEKEGKIITQSVMHISKSVLPQNYYVAVKDMYQKAIEQENKKIILVKK